MSRSWNTAPYRVQKRRAIARGQGWRLLGYPAKVGGAWPGRHGYAHWCEVQLRARTRLDLHHGREPLQKVARRVRWMIW